MIKFKVTQDSIARRAVIILCFLLTACGAKVPQNNSRIEASLEYDNLPNEVLINGVEFVLIPAGWFYKSVNVGDYLRHEDPLVKVWQDSFYIGKFEARATNQRDFMNDQAINNPEFDDRLHNSCVVKPDGDNQYTILRSELSLPASGFNWNQANAFAKWMGFRLPTEAEWEKAARGPNDKRQWPWGNVRPDNTIATFGLHSKRRSVGGCEFLSPVDSSPKGRSPYGIYNMGGNAREFVADWTDNDDVVRQSWLKDGMRNIFNRGQYTRKEFKMLKGGRWGDATEQLSISYREPYPINKPFRCNGLRFALDIEVVSRMLQRGQVVVP